MSTNDLLTDDEHTEVARVILEANASTRRDVLEEIYVQARIAGLCREGAIELLRDAVTR